MRPSGRPMSEVPRASVRAFIAPIRRAIEAYRFVYSHERQLQDGIALALSDAGIEHEREAQLGKAGRVDFLADGVAVEIKVAGSRAAVLRQLHRYAEHHAVSAVLLVTPSLRLHCPEWLVGKPAGVCRIPRIG